MLSNLRARLSAKLQIADAKTAISEAKAVLEDPALVFESNGKARKGWEDAKAGKTPLFGTNADWKAIVEVAVAEVTGKAPAGASKPSASPSSQSSTPTAAKPAAVTPSPAPAAAKPAAAIDPKPAPVASKPAPPATTAASFGKRPDFSNLKGIDRAAASMKWDADRKAHFLAEAEKIIAAEEAAAKGDPTAGKPVTAQSIASEILRQQAEAEKPKSSAWSREAGERRERVKKLAAELAAKDPQ